MNQLKELREEATMTVRELSERSGVSEDTITKIENGHRKGRSMTLRKLAKALGVEPYQLSPEQFAQEAGPNVLPQNKHFSSDMATANRSENTVKDAHIASMLEAAIERAYDVMRAIERPADNPPPQPPQERYLDGVPRMAISGRQQRVLITVLEHDKVGPPAIAGRLEISVNDVLEDLSSLERHGLVAAEVPGRNGRYVISPLGRDLVEAIGTIRSKVHYDKALNHIATLMETYEAVAGTNPHELTEERASLYLLQELTIQSIRRVVAAAEPPPVGQTRTQKFRETLWVNSSEIRPPADLWGLARKVWVVLDRFMTSPPSQQIIRADIEGVPPTEVLEALDLTVAACHTGRYAVLGEDDERVYKQFLWNLRSRVGLPGPTQATTVRATHLGSFPE